VDRKIIAGAALFAAAALFGIGTMTFGKTGHERNVPQERDPVAVTTVTIEPKPIDTIVSAAGALNSRNVSVISSKVMGSVAALTVNEGDHVTAGKLLMRIDSGEITAKAYQAQAAYTNAKLQYDRIKTLYDENAATRVEMDQATLGFESAKAGLNAAKAMQSYTAITAPITGQIVEKRINLGEMAVPGQPILKIEDNRNLRLEVTMKERDIPFVRPGQPVTVRIDALPDREIRGRVSQVVPAADVRTHSFIVKIDVPADKGLITGMYGKAFFKTGKREAVLVPRSAVVEMSGLTGVYIVSPEGNAVFQMVQLGEGHEDRVEALTGLKTGDRVVVSGQDAKIDGRKVMIAQKQ
jgi:RND family efflux transporter MFP subunit